MENISSDSQIHEHSLRIVAIIIFLLTSCFTFGQNLSTQSKKASKYYLKAEKKHRERDFIGAIDFLEEAVKADPLFFEAFIRMGSLYNALGKEDSVYSKFSQYIKIAPNPVVSILERLAFMSFDRGHYHRSNEYLTSLLKKEPEKSKEREISILSESIKFSLNQIKNAVELKITELPKEINKYKLQYLPAMTVDDNTLVYTKRDQFSSDEDIVISFKKKGRWSNSISISDQINTSLNEGAATISADGRTMIFTSCDRKDSYGSCDLYISRKVGDRWLGPRNLGSRVNTKYWESQPSLSADGKTLFFASNRPGGFGKRDLWVTYFRDNLWTNPSNLGEKVNSFKDETTPFIHFNNQTLFLSSNSYPGMGGFDLFKVDKVDSLWTPPENLGYPINTYRDEVALLINAEGDKGYFAKEVKKNREILDSRIVGFVIPHHIRPQKSYFLTGKVVNKKTQKPLKASLQIVDISTNELLYNNYSDSITGDYYMVLPRGKDLAGYIKKKGYLYKDFSFSTSQSDYVYSDTMNIELLPIQEGESIILKNIYFEINSYDLDDRSKSEIENVHELLLENPKISIEIGGHTDNIGTKEYNKLLSLKRAESVYNALVEKGIKEERLKYTGYGDSRPLNPNTNELNRKSNRRIEFRVLRAEQ
ncbi:MAG: OmpA family protein [Bacteroidota bacterium]